MHKVYINIGSNQGDRETAIGRAVALIEHLCGSPARRSTIIESDPWGYESSNRFMNMGIVIMTSMPPEKMLKSLLDIEKSISSASHRDGSGNYVDRIIDIDLIAYDDLIIDSESLTLPHPRMHLREFVLRPLALLWPDWRHPILDLTAQELLDSMTSL